MLIDIIIIIKIGDRSQIPITVIDANKATNIMDRNNRIIRQNIHSNRLGIELNTRTRMNHLLPRIIYSFKSAYVLYKKNTICLVLFYFITINKK